MDPLDAATADSFPDLPARADITVNPLTATEYLHLGRVRLPLLLYKFQLTVYVCLI